MEAKQEKTFAMLCHLGALAGFIIPFGNIIAPLEIWLVKKEESALVNENGKKSLNFQITMTIYSIVAAILMAVVIGFILLPVIAIFNIVMVIMASVATNKGEDFNYALSLNLIK